MAKDPATLWYWNDWIGGTMTMTRHLKGCYMDLLGAQFNDGRLSLDQIKTVLGSDFGSAWPAIQKKFTQDSNGNWYNEKADITKEKRKVFTESRRNNLKNKKCIPHMVVHMENENRNEDVVNGLGVQGEGELSDMEVGKSVEYARITLHRDYDTDKIKDLWKAFCIQNDGKFYQNFSDKVNHFRNSLKNIPYEKKGNEKLGTSEARIRTAENW